MAAHEIQNYHAKLDLLNSKVNSKSDQLVAEVIWFGILEKFLKNSVLVCKTKLFKNYSRIPNGISGWKFS